VIISVLPTEESAVADDIKFVEGNEPSRPGAFYMKGCDALQPGAVLAIFERIKGRPATPEEIAAFQTHTEPNRRTSEAEPF
jgi:hypothetical protein